MQWAVLPSCRHAYCQGIEYACSSRRFLLHLLYISTNSQVWSAKHMQLNWLPQKLLKQHQSLGLEWLWTLIGSDVMLHWVASKALSNKEVQPATDQATCLFWLAVDWPRSPLGSQRWHDVSKSFSGSTCRASWTLVINCGPAPAVLWYAGFW